MNPNLVLMEQLVREREAEIQRLLRDRQPGEPDRAPGGWLLGLLAVVLVGAGFFVR